MRTILILVMTTSSSAMADFSYAWWNEFNRAFAVREKILTEVQKDIYDQNRQLHNKLDRMNASSRTMMRESINAANAQIPRTAKQQERQAVEMYNYNTASSEADHHRLVATLTIPRPTMAAILHGRTEILTLHDQLTLLSWYAELRSKPETDIKELFAALVEDLKTQAPSDYSKLMKTPPPKGEMSSEAVNKWVDAIVSSEPGGFGGPDLISARRIVLLTRKDAKTLKEGKWPGRPHPPFQCKDAVQVVEGKAL